MRTPNFLTLMLLSLIAVSPLSADTYQERLEAKKQDIRSMRYARLKKQHEENLAEIERLKKDLAQQNEQLDKEINDLQELIMSQEEMIHELTSKVQSLN